MQQHDPVPDLTGHQPNALSSAQNSTPRGIGKSSRSAQAAAWISALAALITAITGLAVALIDHF